MEEVWLRQQRQRLQGRWKTAGGEVILRKIVVALQSRQPWTHLVETLPEVEDVYDRRDLRGAPLAGATLAGADLRGVKLSFADLSGADLSGANLSGSELDNADFSHTNLRDADMTGNFVMDRVNLAGANLIGVEMAYATVAGADLTDANFSYAQLDHTTFLGVKKEGAIFVGAKLHKTEFKEFAPQNN